MGIKKIHSYLVPPLAGKDDFSSIKGTAVEAGGKLYGLLAEVYEKSDTDCRIDISFNIAADGTQQNPIRSLLTKYHKRSTIENGREMAQKLAAVTTNRSRLGLLFLIAGNEGRKKKIVIARFPADSGILAEDDSGALNLQFIERVFMKSAKAFKAVVYSDLSLETGFWKGKAIDKQVNTRETNISEYWIAQFLESDFLSTSAAGTRRLAMAMKNANLDTDDLVIKQELAAGATLAKSLAGRILSAEEFFVQFGFSDPTKELMKRHLGNSRVVTEKFKFDVVEFSDLIRFRSVELDSGATLTAPADKFDEVVVQEETGLRDTEDGRIRLIVEGKVINQKLRKTAR